MKDIRAKILSNKKPPPAIFRRANSAEDLTAPHTVAEAGSGKF